MIAVAAQDASPFQLLGFNFLVVFIFLAFSRIFDVKFSSFHITGISWGGVRDGDFERRVQKVALGTNIGRAMLGFTICFGLSVPFSLWRGGSLPIFRDTWLTFLFVAFLATAGLTMTLRADAESDANSLAWALFVFVIIANVFGTMETGRLFLPQGKFANPNEMAQALLIGLPLWIAKMAEHGDSRPEESLLRGRDAADAANGLPDRVARRHDRVRGDGAVRLPARHRDGGRAQMLLGTVLLLGFILVAMPGKLVSRYKTVASDEVDDDSMDETMRSSALTSTQSRKALLKNSIKFTIRHPLFGVGPGMFVVADDDEAQAAQGQRKGQWLGTHNSYTQVSSELGIPAFCFFVAAIVMATSGPYQLSEDAGRPAHGGYRRAGARPALRHGGLCGDDFVRAHCVHGHAAGVRGDGGRAGAYGRG